MGSIPGPLVVGNSIWLLSPSSSDVDGEIELG